MATKMQLFIYVACFAVCLLSIVITGFNQRLYNLIQNHLHLARAWTIVEQFLENGQVVSEQLANTHGKIAFFGYPEIRVQPWRVLELAKRLVQSRFPAEYVRWKTATAGADSSVPNSEANPQGREPSVLGNVATLLSEQVAAGRNVDWQDLLAIYEAETGTAKSFKRTIDYEQVCRILRLTQDLLVEKHTGSQEECEKRVELIRRSVPLDGKGNIIIIKKGSARWATQHEAPVKEFFLFTPFTPTAVAKRIWTGGQGNEDLPCLHWKDRKLALLQVTLVLALIMLISAKTSFFSALQLPTWLQFSATVILVLSTLYAATIAVLSCTSAVSLIRAEVALSGEVIETTRRLLTKLGAAGLFRTSDVIIESIFPTSIFMSMTDMLMLHEDTNLFEVKEYIRISERLTKRLLYSQARGNMDDSILATYLRVCKKLQRITGNPLYQKLEEKARRDFRLEG